MEDIVGLIVNNDDAVVHLLAQKEVGHALFLTTNKIPEYLNFCHFIQPPSEPVQRAKWRLLKSKAMSQHISHLSNNLSVCVDKAVLIGQDFSTVPPSRAGPKMVAGAGDVENGSIATDCDSSIASNSDGGDGSSMKDGRDDDASGENDEDSATGDNCEDGDSHSSVAEEDTPCRKKAPCTGVRRPRELSVPTHDFSATSSYSSSLVHVMKSSTQEQTMRHVLPEMVKCHQLSSRRVVKNDKTCVSRRRKGTSSQVVELMRCDKDSEKMMNSLFIGSLFAKKKALKVSDDALPTIAICCHSLLST